MQKAIIVISLLFSACAGPTQKIKIDYEKKDGMICVKEPTAQEIYELIKKYAEIK